MTQPDERDPLDDFVRLFRRLVRQVLRDQPQAEPVIHARIQAHLGEDPRELPIVSQSWRAWDHVNFQLAIDAYLAAPGVEFELLGITAPHKHHMEMTLSDLLLGQGPMGVFGLGSVDYVKLPSGPNATHSCVAFGLWLVRTPDAPLAVLVRPDNEHGMSRGIAVDVMGRDGEIVDAFHARLRELALEHNVFRGQVLSLGGSDEMFGPQSYAIRFHERVVLPREALVMPPGTLERIERHTVGMADMRDALRAAGRHLKRGVLLHGPPGTGKTLTARYLIGRLDRHTVLLLTGSGLGMVGEAAEVARALQPAVVILEDCDLVAEERTFPGAHNPVLFELLNAMDGVSDDADLLFVLTTNRPDLLEPALAARPGRVDLAIEIPLPDDECRRRLLARYFEGVDAHLDDVDSIVERTEGITASFVKELVRASTVLALESGGAPPVVRDQHVTAALDGLLDEGSALTSRLLGGAADRPPPSTLDSMDWMPGASAALRMLRGRSMRYGGGVTSFMVAGGVDDDIDLDDFDDE